MCVCVCVWIANVVMQERPPAAFITGLIFYLDSKVVGIACRAIRANPDIMHTLTDKQIVCVDSRIQFQRKRKNMWVSAATS